MSIQTMRVGAADHPATQAWAMLAPGRPDPAAVTRLKGRAKGKVYRLEGVGPRGSNVIAKRSSRARILRERVMYERVLPELPISRVRYYGSVDEPDTDY